MVIKLEKEAVDEVGVGATTSEQSDLSDID